MQPSGSLHLGNYLGALRQWVDYQGESECIYSVVDLHALTGPFQPQALAAATLDMTATWIAAGIDPDRSCIFVQSHVPAHSELCWLLSAVTSYGELSRMTQFKDKTGYLRSADRDQEFIATALFTYPVLMAADILVYQADRVPVGDDQRQHLELSRNLAERFNHRFGATFKVPEAAIPTVAARVMDLSDPTRKMSKSIGSGAGCIFIDDDDSTIARKVSRAVTDSLGSVAFDPVNQPGVANLLSIWAALAETTPQELAESCQSYSELKKQVADVVVETIGPIRRRKAEILDHPDELLQILAAGADRARAWAAVNLAAARRAMGLLPG